MIDASEQGDSDPVERSAHERDLRADTRDRRADVRDAEADRRDAEADVRDAEASVRDAEANARDAEAAVRDAQSEREMVEGQRRAHEFDVEAGNESRLQLAERADSARLRSLSAQDRLMAAEDRERSRIASDLDTGQAQDRQAEYDRAADKRDAVAEARDESRGRRDDQSNKRADVHSQFIESDLARRSNERDQSETDREQAGRNREDSFEDRHHSNLDREFSLTTRERARREFSEMEERETESFAASRRDSMTGLSNRRELDERLAQRFDGTAGGFSPVLMFCDVDHLKRINDEGGHAAGDDVLKCIGRRLADLVDSSDLVARVGGDEFVIVTNQPTTMDDALKYADQVREAVSEPIPVGEKQVQVTLSIGLASAANCQSARQLLENADTALYEAKETGRNRCSSTTTNRHPARSLTI